MTWLIIENNKCSCNTHNSIKQWMNNNQFLLLYWSCRRGSHILYDAISKKKRRDIYHALFSPFPYKGNLDEMIRIIPFLGFLRRWSFSLPYKIGDFFHNHIVLNSSTFYKKKTNALEWVGYYIYIYSQHDCKCLFCIQTTIPNDLDKKRKIQLNVTTKHKDFWYHYKGSCFVLLMWDIMTYALESSLYQDLLYLIMFFIVWKLDLLMTQKDCDINL